MKYLLCIELRGIAAKFYEVNEFEVSTEEQVVSKVEKVLQHIHSNIGDKKINWVKLFEISSSPRIFDHASIFKKIEERREEQQKKEKENREKNEREMFKNLKNKFAKLQS